MKHKIWIYHLISALFAFVLAVSSVGNLITGYELPVHAMWKICLWCAFAAIAVAVLFRLPHSGKILIGLAALTVFVLCLAELLQPHIRKQIETLFYYITSHYHDVYSWPVLGELTASDVSVPLILWAVFVATSVNWYICRRKYIAVAIIPTVAPLVLCLLTEDKVPHALYLFLLIAGLAILLLTDFTRKNQPDQSTKLVIWFTLPITLSLVLLFICNPKASYVNYAGKIQKELSVWFEEAQDAAISVMTGTPIGSSADKTRNLQAVGERSKSSRSVMVVNSPIDGILYLRERDYDVYTGTAWEASSERKENFTAGGSSVGTLTILTYSTRGTLFVPYYATVGIEMVGGALENEQAFQQYSYELSPKLTKRTSFPGAQYRELPAETQAWAKELVSQITDGVRANQEKITKIQDYVRNSAVYDTAIGRMDSSHSDFAKWFLEECEAGYCIHYATAATVLLRAAGIPARYVEGYIVNGKSGTDVAVSKQQAHAWVEYYDTFSRAWCILETTPVYLETQRPEAVPGKPQIGEVVLGNTGDVTLESNPSQEPSEPVNPTEDTSIDPTLPEETEIPEEPTDDPADGPADDPNPQNQGATLQKLLKWIKIPLGCIFFVFCIWLQRYARIRRQRKLWNRGAPNKRTIWRWRKTRSLAKLLSQYYPEELDDLAKKARFSQHEIQPDELQQYEDYRLTLVAVIGEKPWYQKMFFKWILAIA